MHPTGPSLEQRLATVPGFDLAVALRNVGDNPAALERVLRTFTRRYPSGEPALCRAVGPDTLKQWRDCCHSLRGACATLGVASLPSGFADFEAALTPQADLAALAPAARALHEELQRVVHALLAALGPPVATS